MMLTLLKRLARDPIILAALVFGLAVLVHLEVVLGDFVMDDVPAVAENPVVMDSGAGLAPLSDVLSRNFWGSRPGYEHVTTWRPLTTLSFRVNALFGSGPAGFRVVNVLLHGLVAGLVVLLGARLSGSARLGLLAGLFFAVMPVHVEAIASTANRSELLTAAFVIGTLLALRRTFLDGEGRTTAVAVVCFAAALLSKENAILVPGFAALLWGFLAADDRRRALPPLRPGLATSLAFAAALGAWVLGRKAVLPAVFSGDIPWLDSPAASEPFLVRLWTGFVVFKEALRTAFSPVVLSADYGANTLMPRLSPAEPGVLLGLLLAAGLVALAVWAYRRVPLLTFGLAAFGLALVPMLGVLLPSSVVFAERLVYLPSVFMALAVAAVVDRALAAAEPIRFGWAVALVFGVALALQAIRTLTYVPVFKDDLSLAEGIVKATPESVRGRQNLAHALFTRGRVDEAELAALIADYGAGGDPDAKLLLGEVAWWRADLPAALRYGLASFELRHSRATVKLLCRAASTLGQDRAATLHWCGLAAHAHPDEPEWSERLGVAN
ncbi:MAG: glycosyltransferase family 39 protein [Myxococcales bacterium]|nr:glycosyltransferase family 39 protein [Myxococcales bacterium]